MILAQVLFFGTYFFPITYLPYPSNIKMLENQKGNIFEMEKREKFTKF